ncbi:MAG TPA: hypothetical protein VFM55_11195 [Micromonosporaceae bacterium]|nr:hypothetical protein [Micromonosporaceae bacterium]
MAVDYVDYPPTMLRREPKKFLGEHLTTVRSPVVVPIGHYLPHLPERRLSIVLVRGEPRKRPKPETVEAVPAVLKVKPRHIFGSNFMI